MTGDESLRAVAEDQHRAIWLDELPVPRKRARSTRAEDRAAVNRLLGLVDDPEAHGRHAITPRGRVVCRDKQYKWGYAMCQIMAPCPHTYVAIRADVRANWSYRCKSCGDFVKPIDAAISAVKFVTI